LQPQATQPKDDVAVGVAANTGAMPISRSLDVSAAMNKPGFKRSKRRTANPSAIPAVVANLAEESIAAADDQAAGVPNMIIE